MKRYLTLAVLLLAVPAYATDTIPLDRDGVTTSADSVTLVGAAIAASPSISTAQSASNPDSLTLRTSSANGSNGVSLVGPSSSTSGYALLFPATAPTSGQIPIFGTPSGDNIPVTWGANGSGGTMVYPGSGVAVSTGSAWGTSLNITAISDSTSTTSSTTAASATAVKAAYDHANGAITPTSVAATGNVTSTGLIDGTAPTVLSTATTYTLGSTYKTNYTYNNYATNGTAITYTLPTAAAGRTECVGNYISKTGTLRVNTSASGQYIVKDGVASATGGYVISGGALGDGACFVGADSTHWVMYTGKGTWTLN